VNPDRPLRVLVVDDEPDLLALLDAVLMGPGTEVVGLASNGADAVKVATTMAVDVAIVDFMMPGMDGFETATALKEVRPECTVLLFSALDLGHEADDHPAVDYFLKKSSISQLDSLLDTICVELGLAR
jgi:two-component system, OmpR family, response regulator